MHHCGACEGTFDKQHTDTGLYGVAQCAVGRAHALHCHSLFALTSGRFNAPMQLALSQDYMSAAARDRLKHARPGRIITWY